MAVNRPRARRLKAIAAWINANMPGYAASVERGYCNTDRKVGRFRRPGKGRYGSKIVVRRGGEVVLKHNSAETYRSNSEVEAWLAGELARGAPRP